jgi:hypothetical protein
MGKTATETKGLPIKEAGLVEIDELAHLIKSARIMARPPMLNQEALAQAMTKAGVATPTLRVYGFETRRIMPSATELLLIAALTRPPGGLAHFAPAFPKLWTTLETDLARTPRIAGVKVEPVRACFAVCDECGEVSPTMDNARYPDRLDSVLREWTAKHKETHGGGEQ